MSENQPPVTDPQVTTDSAARRLWAWLAAMGRRFRAWYKANFHSVWYTVAYAALMAAGLLIIGRILALDLLWWRALIIAGAMVIGTVFYVVTVLIQGWRRAREWVIQRSVTFVTLLAMLILAFGFVLWLVVNFFWAADERLASQDSARFTTAAGAEVLVSADTANVALADATDNRLRLTFKAADGGVLPVVDLVATVEPNEHLIVAGAATRPAVPWPLRLGPPWPATASVSVANALSYAGLRRTEAIDVAITEAGAVGQTPTTLHLPVTVEGKRGFALRRFVTGTINQNSPYIFLLLLIAPGLAALTQRTIDKRYEELMAFRREAFGRLTERCREQFRARDLTGVAATIEEMSTREYDTLRGDTPEVARSFLRFAELSYALPAAPPVGADEAAWAAALREWPPKEQQPSAARWPEEFIGAWLEARRSLEGYGPTSAPLAKLEAARDAAARAACLRLKALVDDARERILSWDTTPFGDQALVVAFKAKVASDYVRTGRRPDSGGWDRQRYLRVPFAHDKAQHSADANFLLDDGFYGRHHLWHDRLMAQPRNHYLIYGQAGCGRTAWATMLHRGKLPMLGRLLRVQLTRPLDMAAIRGAVMEELFDRLLADPSMLSLLNENQAELLADLLLAHLSYGWVLFQIEEAQKRPDADEPVDPPADARDALLQKFKTTVQRRQAQNPPRRKKRPQAQESTPLGDYRAIAAMAGALTFDGIVLIVDAAPDQAAAIHDVIFGHLERWRPVKTYFHIFAPSELRDALIQVPYGPLPADLAQEALIWSDKELQELAQWRYGCFLNRHGQKQNPEEAMRALFSEEALLDRVIAASRRKQGALEGEEPDHDPRRFMQLWQLIVKTRTLNSALVISGEEVTSALAEFEAGGHHDPEG